MSGQPVEFSTKMVEELDLHSFRDTHGVLITTMNDVPGYKVDRVIGTVYGLVVRTRNIFSTIGAGLKSLFGGELGALTQNLYLARNIAVERCTGEALARGANAIIAMRYDNGTLNGTVSTEVCAYGTACIISKIE